MKWEATGKWENIIKGRGRVSQREWFRRDSKLELRLFARSESRLAAKREARSLVCILTNSIARPFSRCSFAVTKLRLPSGRSFIRDKNPGRRPGETF